MSSFVAATNTAVYALAIPPLLPPPAAAPAAAVAAIAAAAVIAAAVARTRGATQAYVNDLPPPSLDLQQLLHAAAPEAMDAAFRSISLVMPSPAAGASPYEAWCGLRLEMQ
eukprot:1004557-Prymnesium_polylepis.1